VYFNVLAVVIALFAPSRPDESRVGKLVFVTQSRVPLYRSKTDAARNQPPVTTKRRGLTGRAADQRSPFLSGALGIACTTIKVGCSRWSMKYRNVSSVL
jgi:hypothetical protein